MVVCSRSRHCVSIHHCRWRYTTHIHFFHPIEITNTTTLHQRLPLNVICHIISSFCDYSIENRVLNQIRRQHQQRKTMTGATTTVMQCRRRPVGEISDSKDVEMCVGVVVGIVHEIVFGIASLINQIFIIVVNCWISDCKKNHLHTPTMSSAVAPQISIWTNPLTTIPSLKSMMQSTILFQLNRLICRVLIEYRLSRVDESKSSQRHYVWRRCPPHRTILTPAPQ